MNGKIICFNVFILILGIGAKAQDDCNSPASLCANSSKSSTTSLATLSGTDPVLSCGDGIVNNSVWFTVLAVGNGNCSITVSNINNNPGLDMEVYTGSCGSLASIGQCASGSSATGGTMNVSFAVTSGTLYFVMVDGNAGNQEGFDIVVTSINDAIVARPDANFDQDPTSGCRPINATLRNTTVLHGGTNITYEWKFDLGGYIPASGADTSALFNVIGVHTTTFRVCNLQCGCKTVSQDITIQDLFPTVTYSPPVSCLNTPMTFNASALILPDPPHVDPGVTGWDWNFGDPGSGAANTDVGQSVSHTFIGPGTTFTVTTIVQGFCGPDTVNTVINLLPKPTVTITGPLEECEGTDVNLSSTYSNAIAPITYNWSGPGSFSCTNCPATTISGIPAGGPYTIDLAITDSLGCAGDTTFDITINEIPTVFAGGFITVCKNDSAQLDAIAVGGYSPYSYIWSPSAGLISSDTIQDPYTFNTSSSNYCVVVTDSKGCVSNPDCVTIDLYPQPTIQPGSINLCLTQTPLTNTFTVIGPNGGSSYSWRLSPSYSRITSAAPDSSVITATFPAAVASYTFIAIVIDAVTGCIDTVSTSFSVDSGLSMAVSGPSTICTGDTATWTVSGAATYSWSASPAYIFADPTDSVQLLNPAATTVFTIVGTTPTCTQTFQRTLTVAPIPTAVINPISSFCGCSSVSLNGIGSSPGMTYLWTSENGSPIASPASLVTNATICINDTIILTVTNAPAGCFSTDTAITISKPKPAAQISVNPNIFCNGVPTLITMDATGSNTVLGTTYHWSNNIGAVISDTTDYPTTDATISGPAVFTLTVTDSAGCDSTITAPVNIHPVPNISANTPFLCASDPVLQSSIDIVGAAPGSTYNWTTIPGCVTPSSTSLSSQVFDFITCGPGLYNFNITVTDGATGCVANMTSSVTVVSGVVLAVSPDTTFCEGGIANLYASGANTYLWNTTDTTDTISIPALAAAVIPYEYYVTGTIGSCQKTDTIYVTVNPVPLTTSINGPDSICENDPPVVYSVSSNMGNNYTWTISGGNIQAGQGSSSVVVLWNTIGLASISVIETNSLNCQGTLQTLNILVSPIPDTPTVFGPTVACSNAIETYFVNANAGSTYTWAVSGGNFVTGPNGSVNSFQWGPAGVGAINVYEVNAPGCAGLTSVYNVTINPSPSPVVVNGNTTACDTLTQLYTLSANAGSTYTWTVTNYLHNTLNPTSDTMSINWMSPGSGNIQVFETNSFSCNSDTTAITVTIYTNPLAVIVSDSDTICNNVAFQILAASSTPNIVWSTNSGGSFNNNSIATPVYQPAATDSGLTTLTMVVSNGSCPNDTGYVILYIDPAPIISVTGPPAPICYGSLDSLSATGGGTYIWTPGGIPAQTIGIRPITTTTYTVTVANMHNCISRDSITVNVLPPGIPDAGSDIYVCAGDPINLNGSQQNGTGLKWYTLGDGTFNPDDTTASSNYAAGANDINSGSVTIVLSSTGACLDLTDTMLVYFSYYSTIILGNDTTLTADKNTRPTLPLNPYTLNVQSVIWTTSGTGHFNPSDTSINTEYVPSDEDYNLDQVVLVLTSTGGNCNTAADTLILDFTPFFIPNIFTPYPLSPGFNDFFMIQNMSSKAALKVFDRWGNIVYSSDEYRNDWDAHGLVSGVYYYVVDTGGKDYKGWVQVMRDE